MPQKPHLESKSLKLSSNFVLTGFFLFRWLQQEKAEQEAQEQLIEEGKMKLSAYLKYSFKRRLAKISQSRRRPLLGAQILKAPRRLRSLPQSPNFMSTFQPGEGPYRGLLCDCEIFVNLLLKL